MYFSNIQYLNCKKIFIIFLIISVFLYVLKKIYNYFFYFQKNNFITSYEYQNFFSKDQKEIIKHFLQYQSICICNFLYFEQYFDFKSFEHNIFCSEFIKNHRVKVLGLEKCKKFYTFDCKPFLYIKILGNQYSNWAIFVHLCHIDNMQSYYQNFVNNTDKKIHFVLILIDKTQKTISTFIFNKFTDKCKKYNSCQLKKILYYMDLIGSNI